MIRFLHQTNTCTLNPKREIYALYTMRICMCILQTKKYASEQKKQQQSRKKEKNVKVKIIRTKITTSTFS